jgi:hypothetical protein
MNTRRFVTQLAVAAIIAAMPEAAAQFATVTMKLDAAQIPVGGSTVLHVYAQVAAAQRAQADRIFSWYVDLVNASGTIADGTAVITKPTADKDPQTSSPGFLDGVNRRGIYDTFLNLPGAGVSAPVELFSVPIKGLAAGNAAFHVAAGSGVPGLGEDFIVAPTGGGDPWLGGDYSQATANLTVGAGSCQPSLTPLLNVQASGAKQLVLNFTVCAGKTHTVEATDDLAHPNWQALPGAPHNSGSITDAVGTGKRFYRVRVN